MRMIWASIVSRAHPLGPHDQAARAVDRAADQLLAGAFLDRDRLAGDHRLVDGARPLDHHAVDGNLLAGTDPQPIAGNDQIQRDILFASILADPARRLGGQPEQGANRTAGLAAGSQLEHLAQQDQRDDHRGRLEIDGDLAVMAGTTRERSRGQAPRPR